MKLPIRFAAVATVAALGLALSACSTPAPADDGDAETPVSVRFALPVNSPDAGSAVVYYMPLWAGFFEEEGLDVEIIPNDGGTAALRQVATGNAEFSINNAQALINAVGEGLGVVGVATVIPRQIYNFYVPEDSVIESVEDLAGTRIGISSATSGVYPFAQIGLAEAGLDYEQDVTLVTTGAGGPQLQALESGDVDAVATWDTQVATFANLGTELRALPPGEIANDPADILVTNTRFLQDNEDVVARFARAIFKAIVYSQANPDAVVEAFTTNLPEAGDGVTPEENLRVIESRLATLQLNDHQENWGDIWIDGYQHLMEMSVEFGAVASEQDLSRVFYLDLLPEIQDFDPESVGK